MAATEVLVFYLKVGLKLFINNNIRSLKCLVDIIKISGKELDRVEAYYGAQQYSMDALFSDVTDIIIKHRDIDRVTIRKLISIVELREAEWGEEQGPLHDSLPEIPVYQSSETTEMFNQNGVTMPSFFQDQMQPDMLTEEVQYLMNGIDENYDDEMMEAFDKFQSNK